jgi:hypothetical protein
VLLKYLGRTKASPSRTDDQFPDDSAICRDDPSRRHALDLRFKRFQDRMLPVEGSRLLQAQCINHPPRGGVGETIWFTAADGLGGPPPQSVIVERVLTPNVAPKFTCRSVVSCRPTRSNHLIRLGAPYGTRTHVTAVKGRRPRPLDEGRKIREA